MWPQVASALDALNLFGTLVSAISGALMATRKGLDPVGAIFLALAAGLGGGTLRDLLLGLTPVFWVRQPSYLLVSFLAGVVVFLLARVLRFPEKTLIWFDAIGLAAFTVTGTMIALAAGRVEIVAVTMGMITAAGGGVLRDLLAAERPLILSGELYVTCALLGSVAFVGLLALGAGGTFAALVAFALALLLRFAAIFWRLELPKGRLKS